MFLKKNILRGFVFKIHFLILKFIVNSYCCPSKTLICNSKSKYDNILRLKLRFYLKKIETETESEADKANVNLLKTDHKLGK